MTRGRERRSQRRVRGVGVWVQGVWGRVGLGEGEGGGKVPGWERVVTIVVFVGGGEVGRMGSLEVVGSGACGWGCVALLQGVDRASPKGPMSCLNVKLHRANAQRMCLMSQVDFTPAAARARINKQTLYRAWIERLEDRLRVLFMLVDYLSSMDPAIQGAFVHNTHTFMVDQPSDHFLSCPFISGGQKVNVQ